MNLKTAILLVILLGMQILRLDSNAAEGAEQPPGNWQLVWSDEFEKDGVPDLLKWTSEVGFVRNREDQYYTKLRKENARVEDGHLVIEARKERWKNAKYDANRKHVPKWLRHQEYADYTSASIKTEGLASWTYGRFEVKAKLPRGRGVWPAIWTLGTEIRQVGWPRCGEIDIMEFVGFEPTTIHANAHCAKYNHADNTGKSGKLDVADVSDAFHVYAVEWHEDRIDYFVDDVKYYTFEDDGTGDEAWPFHTPQYLILNLAIGGNWGAKQGIDDSIFPQQYLIDYVRVYQQASTK